MVRIFPNKQALARAAAEHAHDSLQKLLAAARSASLLAATGASQIDFLDSLTALPGIDWKRIDLFHLDEYAGLAQDHPASFARYIKERMVDRTGIERYHLLNGAREPYEEALRMSREIAARPVDLAFVGIGENGHLAFNDPPADFKTKDPYLVVDLDQASRQQQIAEGWFPSIDDVPTRAITISIHQLIQAKEIICVVPEARKAKPVKECLEGKISPLAPASALRLHSNVTIFLDQDSASLLRERDALSW